jgi:hypothetical protein
VGRKSPNQATAVCLAVGPYKAGGTHERAKGNERPNIDQSRGGPGVRTPRTHEGESCNSPGAMFLGGTMPRSLLPKRACIRSGTVGLLGRGHSAARGRAPCSAQDTLGRAVLHLTSSS